MRRRKLIVGVVSAAACELAARAQQAAMPAIGFLDLGSPDRWKFVSFNRAGGNVRQIKKNRHFNRLPRRQTRGGAAAHRARGLLLS